MLSKDRCKTTAGFFVIPLLSQLWEVKNYWERRNELSSWRSVALPNRHKHLYLFKLGYDVHALLSSVMYILSGENFTAMFTISRRRWDQNTKQVANRLERARATYVRLLHVPPWPMYDVPISQWATRVAQGTLQALNWIWHALKRYWACTNLTPAPPHLYPQGFMKSKNYCT